MPASGRHYLFGRGRIALQAQGGHYAQTQARQVTVGRQQDRLLADAAEVLDLEQHVQAMTTGATAAGRRRLGAAARIAPGRLEPGVLRTSSTVVAEKSPAIRLGMPSAVAPIQVIRSLVWCWRAVASSGSGRNRAT